MKLKDERLHPVLENDSETSIVRENKIELVNCPNNDRKCTKQLQEINNCFAKSDSYIINKEFNLSLDLLRNAFYITSELKDPGCRKCVNLFRSVVSQSVENVYLELEKMPKGIFGTKRFRSNTVEAKKVIDEFGNFEQQNNISTIKASDYFIGNSDAKKCVV